MAQVKPFIKKEFSIKDLEHLSGIKAHTLRIWEQRYAVFNPKRNVHNVRTYSTEDLQKLLNIRLLYDNGLSISKIANLNREEMKSYILEQFSKEETMHHELLKSALHCDKNRFEVTYKSLSSSLDFREIYASYFVPLLDELGTLWHLKVINEVHEHFASQLIQEKIFENYLRVKEKTPLVNQNKEVILFLPEMELHEIPLLYLYYELRREGVDALYLGPATPTESLKKLVRTLPALFISYLTISHGSKHSRKQWLLLENEVLQKEDCLWVGGNVEDFRACQLNSSRIEKIVDLKTLPQKIKDEFAS